jgi:gliding motility-associated-like protein
MWWKGAAQNKVSIYNRWGDIVFEVQNYNNTDRSFTGLSNSGNELPSGNYFYKIEFASGLAHALRLPHPDPLMP